MKRKLSIALAGAALVAVPTTALAGAIEGDAVSLGSFREYCNAPTGYELVVSYAPGTLVGTRIIAGSDEILLNGSGQAVLSRATGPRIRERPIAAVPGENGFDSDHLDLQIIPS